MSDAFDFIEIIGDIIDMFYISSLHKENDRLRKSHYSKKTVKASKLQLQKQKSIALVSILYGLAYYKDMSIDEFEERLIVKLTKNKKVNNDLSRRDIEEIKEDYLKGLTFHYVENMMEVIKIALTNQKVKNAKQL